MADDFSRKGPSARCIRVKTTLEAHGHGHGHGTAFSVNAILCDGTKSKAACLLGPGKLICFSFRICGRNLVTLCCTYVQPCTWADADFGSQPFDFRTLGGYESRRHFHVDIVA
jgi:hypothetical protein